MKTNAFPVVLSLLFCFSNLSFAQIYVKHDATGANNGTSWNDAFTQLKPALNSAVAGAEIWVAAGVYHPDTAGGNVVNTFLLNKNLRLLGGFAGTETAADQRDPAANITILSGDLNGDDIPGDFITNRADNSRRVLQVSTGIFNNTLIDGFTVMGGNATSFGGGLYSAGAPTVRRCFFTQNYSVSSGAGICFAQAGATDALVEQCRFENNLANDWTGGSGMFVRNMSTGGVQVRHCSFTDNTGGRGSGLSCYNASVKIYGCQFVNNINEQQGGALWFFCQTYNGLSLEVDSCQFASNRSSFGGALYVIAAEGTQAPDVDIKNTTFTGNAVSPNTLGWGQGGGAICTYIDKNVGHANVRLNNCNFFQNSSSNNGGGLELYNDSPDAYIEIDQCNFESNSAAVVGAAVSMAHGGEFAEVVFKNSTITENESGIFGAVNIANYNTGGGSFWLHNLLFEKNEANFDAGMSIGSGPGAGLADYSIENCIFRENKGNTAGGLGLWGESPVNFTVRACDFEANTAIDRGGALGINIAHPASNVYIGNCRLLNNSSPDGAAILAMPYYTEVAAETQEAYIRLENCLVTGNSGDNAALAIRQLGRLDLVNCTIAGNNAGGILLDEDARLELQNNLLYNPGFTEIQIPGAGATLQSRGGNLLSDLSLAGAAMLSDQESADPLFAGANDYHLSNASPAIDKGMDYGLSQFDLDGNSRVTGCVDIGAYESATVVSPDCLTGSEEAFAGLLALSPNPCAGHLNIQMPAGTVSAFNLRVFDIRGSVVLQGFIAETELLDVSRLASGMYMVQVFSGKAVYVGRFVKE